MTRYPRCEKLGVLRELPTQTVISTAALHEAVGWEKYKTFLPYMEHTNNSCPTAESCERWLREQAREV